MKAMMFETAICPAYPVPNSRVWAAPGCLVMTRTAGRILRWHDPKEPCLHLSIFDNVENNTVGLVCKLHEPYKDLRIVLIDKALYLINVEFLEPCVEGISSDADNNNT